MRKFSKILITGATGFIGSHLTHRLVEEGFTVGIIKQQNSDAWRIKDSKVVSFTEKPQVSKGLINGGFFVLNRKIFNYLSEDDNCDFEIGSLEQLAKKGELMVYQHKGEWACMDTYRDMNYLNKLWQTGRAFWKI